MMALAADFFAGEASQSDVERLEAWVNTSSRNERMFRSRLRLCYAAMAAGSVPKAKITKHKRSLKIAAAFAAAAMLAGVAFFLFTKPSQDELLPQTTYAVLTTSEGRTIELSEASTVSVGGGSVAVEGESIVAERARLVVPRGGQYELELSDGTRVWLNSESELSFPADFSGEERRVELRGEAFFDVAKSVEKPFIVDLSQGVIAVLGTRFYVSDYADRPLSAVLVEGSIRLCSGGQKVTLNPSQRAVVDRVTGEIDIESIDTGQYTAFTRDRFVFYGQTLGEIAQTLSRWYDVQIIFDSPELASMPLSGNLSRHSDIKVLLDVYRTAAGIDYSIDGKVITLTKK